MKLTKIILGLALTASVTGCSGINDAVDKHVNEFHSSLTACEAWAEWSWCYDELDHPADFAAGFKAGYQGCAEWWSWLSADASAAALLEAVLPERRRPLHDQRVVRGLQSRSGCCPAGRSQRVRLTSRCRRELAQNMQMQATPVAPVNWSQAT